MALTLRLVKGSRLTYAEADANFSGLADGSLWSTAALAAKTFTSLTLSGALTVGGALAANGGLTVGGGLTVSSGQFLAPDGSVAAPAYSFANSPSTGLWHATNNIIFTGGGTRVASAGSGGFFVDSNLFVVRNLAGAEAVTLVADAANALAQRNGLNAQTFRIYKSYTSAADYERLNFFSDSGGYYISVDFAGAGVDRDLFIGVRNGGGGWRFAAGTPHFLASVDNAYDIGSLGANRPRDLHLANGLYVYGGPTVDPDAALGSLFVGNIADGGGWGALGWAINNGVNTAAIGLSGTTLYIGTGTGAANTLTARLEFASTGEISPKGVMLAVDGSVAAPAYSFSAESGTGFYRSGANTLVYTTASLARMAFSGNFTLGSGGAVRWSTTAAATGTPDVTLLRDAANVLALQNGTNGQGFRLYNTFTDAANYERLELQWYPTVLRMQLTNAGTGGARDMEISAGGSLYFGISGAGKWYLYNVDNSIRAVVDNTYDIGASGASRPRTGYFGTSVHSAAGFFDSADAHYFRKTGSFDTARITHSAAGGGIDLAAVDPTGSATYEPLSVSGDGIIYNSNGVLPHVFNTAGGTQARIVHAASAVNYIELHGNSIGNGPHVNAKGSDTNIPLNLSSKGSGDIAFYTNNGVSFTPQFKIRHTASAVNFFVAIGNTTGSGPFLYAEGSDANIDTVFVTKGNGNHQFRTNVSSSLTQFVVAHTASAVNYATVTGGTTGNGPIVSAQGSDSNIALVLQSKGTGAIDFLTGSGAQRQVRILHAASAVDYLTIQGGASGTVTIGTAGTSSNIDVQITPKGTGIVRAQGSAAVNVAGKQAIPIPAGAITPRSANGCASLSTTNGAANQPDIPYLAFDGTAAEYAGFTMRMPKGWNEGAVTAAFSWRRASGTAAANVVWGIRAVAVSDNETPAATFGTGATVTDAASTTTANMNVSGETSDCTIGGSPAEGDLVFFEVYRDGASGSDTLDGVDAWLTEVTLFITTNAPNDA